MNEPDGTRKKIVIVGGGRLGEAIAQALGLSSGYEPLILEVDYDRHRDLAAAGLASRHFSGSVADGLAKALADAEAVICAAPSSVAPAAARAARAAGCHYVDVCEDRAIRERIAQSAEGAEKTFATGCGLAPGYVSALIDDLVARSGPRDDLTVYVGVLPLSSSNRLGYGNIWGVDGLIAEYTGPCPAIVDGSPVTLPPMEQDERIRVGGRVFEAFTTAGSIDDLVARHAGQVNRLVFKTLRDPGHLDYMRFLQDDLRLRERPYMLRNLLLNGLPHVAGDEVFICLTSRSPVSQASGQLSERATTLHYRIDTMNAGPIRSAAGAVTAAHVCAVIDILVKGLAPRGGVLQSSEIGLSLLRRSRFMDILGANAMAD